MLIALFGTFLVTAVAILGVVGIRSAEQQGNEIAREQLATSVVTGELDQDLGAAYTTGETVLRSADPAARSRLLGALYTSLVPAVDAHVFSLGQLPAIDTAADRADLALFNRQWTAVRDLLSPTDLTAQPPPARSRWPADRRLPGGQRPP